MDENQLSSMGDGSYTSQHYDYTMCICSVNDGSTNSSNAIVYYDGDKMYVALNMADMFGGSSDPKGIVSVYIDFCKSYTFDLYVCGSNNNQITYVEETETLEKMMAQMDENNPIPDQVYHTMDEFLNAVQQTYLN